MFQSLFRQSMPEDSTTYCMSFKKKKLNWAKLWGKNKTMTEYFRNSVLIMGSASLCYIIICGMDSIRFKK